MDRYTDSISSRYDKLSGQNCCLSCGSAYSLATILPGNVCIDLGCGKGHDVLRMALLTGEKGFAYGVDVSDGMMETARQQAEIMNIQNIGFVRSNLECIDLQDGIANVIISNCTINHSLNQDKVWKEVARLLKKGGQFVVSDIYALQPVAEHFRSDPEKVAECWAGAVTREVYLDNVTNAGLSNTEVIEESEPYEKGEIRVASFTIRGQKPLS